MEKKHALPDNLHKQELKLSPQLLSFLLILMMILAGCLPTNEGDINAANYHADQEVIDEVVANLNLQPNIIREIKPGVPVRVFFKDGRLPVDIELVDFNSGKVRVTTVNYYQAETMVHSSRIEFSNGTQTSGKYVNAHPQLYVAPPELRGSDEFYLFVLDEGVMAFGKPGN